MVVENLVVLLKRATQELKVRRRDGMSCLEPEGDGVDCKLEIPGKRQGEFVCRSPLGRKALFAVRRPCESLVCFAAEPDGLALRRKPQEGSLMRIHGKQNCSPSSTPSSSLADTCSRASRRVHADATAPPEDPSPKQFPKRQNL